MRLFDRLLKAIEDTHNEKLRALLLKAEDRIRKDDLNLALEYIDQAYNEASFLEQSDLYMLWERAQTLKPHPTRRKPLR